MGGRKPATENLWEGQECGASAHIDELHNCSMRDWDTGVNLDHGIVRFREGIQRGHRGSRAFLGICWCSMDVSHAKQQHDISHAAFLVG